MQVTTGKSKGAKAKKKGARKKPLSKKLGKKTSTSTKKTTKKKSGTQKSQASSGRRQKIMKSGRGLPIDKALARKIFDLMVQSRVVEERMIQIYRKGGAYFWIGGPGEEAFGVPLGLLARKGQGPEFDYLHLHYRCTPTLLAMGMDVADSFRLIMNKATDPCTGGRNFSNHYCYPEWNVVPVSSPIEVQYSMAIGTAHAQSRRKTKGVSIVTGGDAGSAEGDFASCLIWASRPGSELPLYITIQNNKWGISTDYDSQHGEKHVSDRGKPFGIKSKVYNGNDPIETYLGIQEDLEYIRKTGKPVIAEFRVSRLYGHSSASGANRIEGEICCIESFEKRLVDAGVLTKSEAKKIWDQHFEAAKKVADEVLKEPSPTADTLWDHTYVGNENADWRKF
ncbi:MAG: thiamine pyrophosphate-dependent dehydrogenase E1 component subunit alpha [Bdellovibrionales bacterium]|nr:thiamine pyrophosphate-dependent dehydrogenase E1 component subunit alpha [Bdellovibrionales bacterium]